MYAQRKETGANRIPKKLSRGQKNYSKEKAAEHYAKNKGAIKKKSREYYKNLSQEEKDKIKEYQRKKYQEFLNIKKKR